MKLTHWADEAFELEQRTYKQEPDWKPKGFWFDVDEDWKRWCEGETFNLDGLRVPHIVEIADADSILKLSDASELDRFTRKYWAARPWKPGERFDARNCYIDWPRVATQYKGILIAPYCYQRRMELMWYYGWDCASGAVWDTSAIILHACELAVTPANRRGK